MDEIQITGDLLRRLADRWAKENHYVAQGLSYSHVGLQGQEQRAIEDAIASSLRVKLAREGFVGLGVSVTILLAQQRPGPDGHTLQVDEAEVMIHQEGISIAIRYRLGEGTA
jgi:hypothetical protein